MIEKEIYDIMKKKYGKFGSWAIRGKEVTTPTSNTNDMKRIKAPDLLKNINTGYVFVGLNLSSTHGDQGYNGGVDWSNFHSGYSHQQDFKLRYALKGTKYWGSYITDIIKNLEEVDSNKVSSYLKKHPKELNENIEFFKKEISYLGCNLKLVALGSKSYSLLNKYLGNEYEIIKIKHYACRMGKEKYRDEVLSILG